MLSGTRTGPQTMAKIQISCCNGECRMNVTMYGFADLRFKLQWRSYQKRILNELEGHLDDERLHIVAAPGSGKTVLGLEVIRRINRPTLILTPTLAIRNQWEQRLADLFLPDGATTRGLVSMSLASPAIITITTYQALHLALKGEDDGSDADDGHDIDEPIEEDNHAVPLPNDLIGVLRKAGIGTVVLDEAHHLRTAWWRSLDEILGQLENIRIISLTATPPYDVPDTEWKRYIRLCGPVDVEVAVPELVERGEICPHQDLIYFSTPADSEGREITRFRRETEAFIEEILHDGEFLQRVESHPWVVLSRMHEEEILEHPEFFSSMLVYLNHAGVEIPEDSVRLIAGSVKQIPKFSIEWLEILLEGLLFPPDDPDRSRPSVLDRIWKALKRMGAIERRRVLFRKNSRIERLLKQSTSKLASIKEIVRAEHGSMGRSLRMVVLTDYIRKDSLPRHPDDSPPLNKMGVIPIFETIRRENIPGLRLGVLTGSLVILPSESEELARECATEVGLDYDFVRFRTMSHTDRYVALEVSGPERSRVVEMMTKVFTRGGISVLIGTASLLGEGWDAPSINSLVIASFVGSYMLSNQMRGRAIRTQRDNPDKTANIWHLVCVEPDSTYAGEDYETIVRRFRGFVGISFMGPVIENGTERLGIGEPPFGKSDLESLNRRMLKRAMNRTAIADDWETALRRGEEGVRLVEAISIHRASMPRGFVFRNTISALFWDGIFLGLYFLIEYTRAVVRAIDIESLLTFMAFGALFAVIVAMPYVLKALWLAIRHGPIKSSLKRVGEALLRTLIFMGQIRTSMDELDIVVSGENQAPGYVFCHLNGGTNRERWIYLDALEELLGPIDNPRYILVRKSSFFDIFARVDYHPVPALIGAKKSYAEYFAQMWGRYVGRMSLVYTRRRDGRTVLIRARNHSLSAAFVPRSKRRTRWQ